MQAMNQGGCYVYQRNQKVSLISHTHSRSLPSSWPLESVKHEQSDLPDYDGLEWLSFSHDIPSYKSWIPRHCQHEFALRSLWSRTALANRTYHMSQVLMP